jgi:hypothetical protein
MTLMTAMTMHYRGSLKGWPHSAVRSRDDAMGGNIGSASATKSVAVAVPLGL